MTLANERYTGKLISLRTVREELGNPNQRSVPKEDWIVVDNAFEPIIDEDTFQRAQTLFRVLPPRPPRKEAGRSLPLFYRKIVCGVCGQGLMRQKASRTYYRCKEKYGPFVERCRAVRIYEDDLIASVLSELQSRAAASANAVDESSIDESTDGLKLRISVLEQQIEKQWSAKKDAFVKWDSGVISRAAYEDVCAEKRREIQQLSEESEWLKNILSGGPSTASKYSERVAEATAVMELNREIVNALIQTVRVFDDGQIEIEWKNTANMAYSLH